jgi:hypothetical protein
LKNQFRALDEDEIEFLDGLRDAARADESRRLRETEEGVGKFREEQARQESRATADEGLDGVEEGGLPAWAVGAGKKRKRKESGKAIRGVLKRRLSELGKEDHTEGVKGPNLTLTQPGASSPPMRAQGLGVAEPSQKSEAKMGPALVGYDSESDSDG